MADLRARFHALDALEAPDLWTEIERRAATTPSTARVVRGASRSGRVPGMGRLVLVTLLALAAAAALLVAARLIDRPEPEDVLGAWSAVAETAASGFGGTTLALRSGSLPSFVARDSVLESFTFTATEDVLTMTGLHPSDGCEGTTGTWRWRRDDDRLSLELVDDPCERRRELLAAKAFERAILPYEPASLEEGRWRIDWFAALLRITLPQGEAVDVPSVDPWLAVFERHVAGSTQTVRFHAPEQLRGNGCGAAPTGEGTGQAGLPTDGSADRVVEHLASLEGLEIRDVRERTFGGRRAVQLVIRTLPGCPRTDAPWADPMVQHVTFTGERTLVIVELRAGVVVAEAVDAGSLELLDDLGEWIAFADRDPGPRPSL
jgi:hypothetical protein